MSLGPVARTVRTLVDKGLLARAANPLSRRADLIAVTAAGRTLLQKDPRLRLSATADKMPLEQREALAGALETLLYHLFELDDGTQGPPSNGAGANEPDEDESLSDEPETEREPG